MGYDNWKSYGTFKMTDSFTAEDRMRASEIRAADFGNRPGMWSAEIYHGSRKVTSVDVRSAKDLVASFARLNIEKVYDPKGHEVYVHNVQTKEGVAIRPRTRNSDSHLLARGGDYTDPNEGRLG